MQMVESMKENLRMTKRMEKVLTELKYREGSVS